MLNSHKRSLIAAAVLGVTAAGTAQAELKMIAINDIFNFNVGVIGGVNFMDPSFESAATAVSDNLGNISDAANSVDPLNPPDVPLQCLGPYCGNVQQNQTVQVGGIDDPDGSGPLPGPGGFEGSGDESVEDRYFVRGDAVIDNADIFNGNGRARNVAEGSLPFGNDDTVQASGVNALDIKFDVENIAVLSFEFEALPFLEVFSGFNDIYPPTNGRAELTFNITIANNAGDEIFVWAPDGAPGAFLGGTSVLEDAGLNTGLSASGEGGWRIYDPANNVGTNNCMNVACNYLAFTDALPVQNDYLLSIRMTEGISGRQLTAPVPAPATLALMGVGILGAAATRRRRKS